MTGILFPRARLLPPSCARMEEGYGFMRLHAGAGHPRARTALRRTHVTFFLCNSVSLSIASSLCAEHEERRSHLAPRSLSAWSSQSPGRPKGAESPLSSVTDGGHRGAPASLVSALCPSSLSEISLSLSPFFSLSCLSHPLNCSQVQSPTCCCHPQLCPGLLLSQHRKLPQAPGTGAQA